MGNLTMVASNKMNVPGYSDCRFSNFPQVPSVGLNSETVFFGQCDADVAGVFYEVASGDLWTIINYDDKVDNQNLLYVGYGTTSYSGSKAALYIVLEDTTAGITPST